MTATPVANSLLSASTSPRLAATPADTIVISAPAAARSGSTLLVSGTVRMRLGALGLTDHAAHVELVLVGPGGAGLVMPAIFERGSVDDEDRDDGASTDTEVSQPRESSTLVTTWFHTDVSAKLTPGLWHVHAFLGELRSNGLAIRVSADESEESP